MSDLKKFYVARGKYAGAFTHPERYTAEELAQIKATFYTESILKHARKIGLADLPVEQRMDLVARILAMQPETSAVSAA